MGDTPPASGIVEPDYSDQEEEVKPAVKKNRVSSTTEPFPGANELIGCRAQFDWIGEGQFIGTVSAYDKTKKRLQWRVVYDDGDKESGQFTDDLTLFVVQGNSRPIVEWFDDPKPPPKRAPRPPGWREPDFLRKAVQETRRSKSGQLPERPRSAAKLSRRRSASAADEFSDDDDDQSDNEEEEEDSDYEKPAAKAKRRPSRSATPAADQITQPAQKRRRLRPNADPGVAVHIQAAEQDSVAVVDEQDGPQGVGSATAAAAAATAGAAQPASATAAATAKPAAAATARVKSAAEPAGRTSLPGSATALDAQDIKAKVAAAAKKIEKPPARATTQMVDVNRTGVTAGTAVKPGASAAAAGSASATAATGSRRDPRALAANSTSKASLSAAAGVAAATQKLGAPGTRPTQMSQPNQRASVQTPAALAVKAEPGSVVTNTGLGNADGAASNSTAQGTTNAPTPASFLPGSNSAPPTSIKQESGVKSEPGSIAATPVPALSSLLPLQKKPVTVARLPSAHARSADDRSNGATPEMQSPIKYASPPQIDTEDLKTENGLPVVGQAGTADADEKPSLPFDPAALKALAGVLPGLAASAAAPRVTVLSSVGTEADEAKLSQVLHALKPTKQIVTHAATVVIEAMKRLGPDKVNRTIFNKHESIMSELNDKAKLAITVSGTNMEAKLHEQCNGLLAQRLAIIYLINSLLRHVSTGIKKCDEGSDRLRELQRKLDASLCMMFKHKLPLGVNLWLGGKDKPDFLTLVYKTLNTWRSEGYLEVNTLNYLSKLLQQHMQEAGVQIPEAQQPQQQPRVQQVPAAEQGQAQIPAATQQGPAPSDLSDAAMLARRRARQRPVNVCIPLPPKYTPMHSMSNVTNIFGPAATITVVDNQYGSNEGLWAIMNGAAVLLRLKDAASADWLFDDADEGSISDGASWKEAIQAKYPDGNEPPEAQCSPPPAAAQQALPLQAPVAPNLPFMFALAQEARALQALQVQMQLLANADAVAAVAAAASALPQPPAAAAALMPWRDATAAGGAAATALQLQPEPLSAAAPLVAMPLQQNQQIPGLGPANLAPQPLAGAPAQPRPLQAEELEQGELPSAQFEEVEADTWDYDGQVVAPATRVTEQKPAPDLPPLPELPPQSPPPRPPSDYYDYDPFMEMPAAPAHDYLGASTGRRSEWAYEDDMDLDDYDEGQLPPLPANEPPPWQQHNQPPWQQNTAPWQTHPPAPWAAGINGLSPGYDYLPPPPPPLPSSLPPHLTLPPPPPPVHHAPPPPLPPMPSESPANSLPPLPEDEPPPLPPPQPRPASISYRGPPNLSPVAPPPDSPPNHVARSPGANFQSLPPHLRPQASSHHGKQLPPPPLLHPSSTQSPYRREQKRPQSHTEKIIQQAAQPHSSAKPFQGSPFAGSFGGPSPGFQYPPPPKLPRSATPESEAGELSDGEVELPVPSKARVTPTTAATAKPKAVATSAPQQYSSPSLSEGELPDEESGEVKGGDEVSAPPQWRALSSPTQAHEALPPPPPLPATDMQAPPANPATAAAPHAAAATATVAAVAHGSRQDSPRAMASKSGQHKPASPGRKGSSQSRGPAPMERKAPTLPPSAGSDDVGEEDAPPRIRPPPHTTTTRTHSTDAPARTNAPKFVGRPAASPPRTKDPPAVSNSRAPKFIDDVDLPPPPPLPPGFRDAHVREGSGSHAHKESRGHGGSAAKDTNVRSSTQSASKDMRVHGGPVSKDTHGRSSTHPPSKDTRGYDGASIQTSKDARVHDGTNKDTQQSRGPHSHSASPEHDQSAKARHRSRSRSRSHERGAEKGGKDKHQHKKEKHKHKEKDKDREKSSKHKDRDKERDRDRDRDRDKDKDKGHRSSHGDKEKDRDGDKDRDKKHRGDDKERDSRDKEGRQGDRSRPSSDDGGTKKHSSDRDGKDSKSGSPTEQSRQHKDTPAHHKDSSAHHKSTAAQHKETSAVHKDSSAHRRHAAAQQTMDVPTQHKDSKARSQRDAPSQHKDSRAQQHKDAPTQPKAAPTSVHPSVHHDKRTDGPTGVPGGSSSCPAPVQVSGGVPKFVLPNKPPPASAPRPPPAPMSDGGLFSRPPAAGPALRRDSSGDSSEEGEVPDDVLRRLPEALRARLSK